MPARLTDGLTSYGLYPARLFRGALFPFPPQARAFAGEEAALSFLMRCIDGDPSVEAGLRRVLLDLGGSTMMLHGEWVVAREAARRICSSELLLIPERAVVPSGGVEPPPFKDAETTPLQAEQQAKEDKPAEEEKKPKTWIEIRLLNEDDEPVPGESYRVELPDGTVKKGTLNSKGAAYIGGIDPGGDCKVTFTSLDEEAWEPIGG